MKTLLFTLVLTLIVFTAQGMHTREEIEKFKELHEKCCKESGFDPQTMVKSIEEAASNQEFKCMLKCMMMELGNMDESGALDMDKIKAQDVDIPAEVWGKAVDECKDQNDDDLCEKAYKLTKCVADEVEKALS